MSKTTIIALALALAVIVFIVVPIYNKWRKKKKAEDLSDALSSKDGLSVDEVRKFPQGAPAPGPDGTKQEKIFPKEDDRFYFYDGRCSFILPKESIKEDMVEKDGLKHVLMTEQMAMTILEIRPCMPALSGTPVTIAGYPGLHVQIMGLVNQYYINCGSFVVQVDMVIPSMEFLNSFRIEK